jgi:hypothetical protein
MRDSTPSTSVKSPSPNAFALPTLTSRTTHCYSSPATSFDSHLGSSGLKLLRPLLGMHDFVQREIDRWIAGLFHEARSTQREEPCSVVIVVRKNQFIISLCSRLASAIFDSSEDILCRLISLRRQTLWSRPTSVSVLSAVPTLQPPTPPGPIVRYRSTPAIPSYRAR